MKEDAYLLKYLLLALAIFLSQSAFAAEYSTIRNIQEPAQPVWAPGMVIVLPDESVTIIEEELPTGDLRTSGGIVITQDGKVNDTNREIKAFRQQKLEL